MATTTSTSTWRGEGGVWTGTFTADIDDKQDKIAKGKGKSKDNAPPSLGGVRDRRAGKTRDGKSNAKAKAKPASGLRPLQPRPSLMWLPMLRQASLWPRSPLRNWTKYATTL